MTIPQVQGSPAMELFEGKINRRSVSGLSPVGGETSIVLFNLFCSNVSKQDVRVCSLFNHNFCDCVPTYDSFCIYHFAFFYSCSPSSYVQKLNLSGAVCLRRPLVSTSLLVDR